MKCPDCGNINVDKNEERKDGVSYHCSPCDKDFVYDNGQSE
jgi:transposase-like protein